MINGKVAKNPLVIGRTRPRPLVASRIPNEITENEDLIKAVKSLPANYNFEVYKVVWTIKRNGYKRVSLQFPEGLQMYALTIADIIEKFTGSDTIVMGDVVYGACCIDDYTAKSLNCDFIIHYGHSCLVPINSLLIKSMYVFVSIKFDHEHLISTIKKNFKPGDRLLLSSTVQFLTSIETAKNKLSDSYFIKTPQEKPLSSGEVLGCTAPKISESPDSYNAMIFIGDGRFHLEALLIANPSIQAYLYNPYSNEITRETYNHNLLVTTRQDAIAKAARAKNVGLILGTLGRQGSIKVINYLKPLLKSKSVNYCIVLLSEISAEKLSYFKGIDVWIQTSCPRLSIDWGYSYPVPVITPFEAAVAMKACSWKSEYPMDYYSANSLGPWTPLYNKS